MTIKRTLVSLVLGLSALVSASAALAGSVAGTLSVNTLVSNACTISDATMTMTAYTQTTGATGTGTPSINCNLLSVYTVTLGQGLHYSGGSNRMKATVASTDYYIPYSLVTPVGTLVGTLVGTGLAVPTAIVGSAAAGVNVPAATYSDSVVMTVSF